MSLNDILNRRQFLEAWRRNALEEQSCGLPTKLICVLQHGCYRDRIEIGLEDAAETGDCNLSRHINPLGHQAPVDAEGDEIIGTEDCIRACTVLQELFDGSAVR